MAKKELPFKSIKITLSSEALHRLDYITKQASFRSYSSGIEECVRVVYDLIREIYSVAGDTSQSTITLSEENEAEAFKRILMRMARFTGRAFVPESKK